MLPTKSTISPDPGPTPLPPHAHCTSLFLDISEFAGVAASKLPASEFSESHPLVWALRHNSRQLFDLFEQTLQDQYKSYDVVVQPKLDNIVIVRERVGVQWSGALWVHSTI